MTEKSDTVLSSYSNKIALPSYTVNDGLEARLSNTGMSIMKTKFLQRDDSGNIIETPQERFYTIAKTMAEVERGYGKDGAYIDNLTERFYEMLSSLEFLPGGRTITNTGKGIALFNCYVLPVNDSIESIFESVKKAAMIHKQGGGTGYNFSRLRPRGSYVKRSQGIASGPMSFIEQFDKQTEIINSGNRRGANMGILNVDHPDILDFIYSKTTEEKLKNFNISVGVTDEFMRQVKGSGFYQLIVWEKESEKRPYTRAELETFIANIEKNKAGADVGQKARPHSFSIKNGKLYDARADKEVGRFNGGAVELDAVKVFDLIANLAWKTADPGIVFLDRIAEHNPLPSERFDATNPCGEQPLHAYDACNLGSINLARFVDSQKKIDYEKLRERVVDVVRFMDNVNDVSRGPISDIEQTVLKNRRIGLGVMGFADMLIRMGVRYDSEEGLNVAEDVMKFINERAYEASRSLAKEKGAFPNINKSIYVEKNEEVRNLQRTTIAPTGSISMLAGVSSGIEPNYAVTFRKNMRGGDSAVFFNSLLEAISKERGFYSEDLAKKIDANNGNLEGMLEIPADIRNIVRTAMEISPEWHVRMQAAFQKHVENAVSKTINMPNSAKVEDVKAAYLLAWETGLKGITVYRDGCKSVQVLDLGTEKKKELARGEIEVLSETMNSRYIKQKTPWGTLHVHIDHGVDGKPKQIFSQLGKAGEVVSADLEAITRLMSQNLRMGGSVEGIIDQVGGIGSQKMVPTKEGTISSIADALAVVLRKYSEINKVESLKPENIDVKKIAKTIKEGNGAVKDHIEYNELCPECKSPMKADSGCWSCSAGCGYSRC